MNQLNELNAGITNLMKRSYEQTTQFSSKVGEEAGRVIEGQFDQVRELMELGMQTQSTVWNEWVKSTTTARDMWTEAVESFAKTFETKTPAKTSKAS